MCARTHTHFHPAQSLVLLALHFAPCVSNGGAGPARLTLARTVERKGSQLRALCHSNGENFQQNSSKKKEVRILF